MTHSEAHRQFYLSAAGIRMWYAKRPLPGAAPSPEYQSVGTSIQQQPVFRDHSDIGVLPAASRPPKGNKPAVHRTVDLQSLMDPAVKDKEARSPSRAKAKVDPVAESGTAGPVEENPPEPSGVLTEAVSESGAHAFVAAHLGIWSTRNYLLISQWSDEASERLQDSLAGNLLKALRQAEVGERQMLHWPVFRNSYIPGNSPDDLREILSRLLSPYQDQSIILLGVLSGEQQDQRQHCLKPALSRVGVDFPYSLAELSAMPDHKRDLWAALKSRYSL